MCSLLCTPRRPCYLLCTPHRIQFRTFLHVRRMMLTMVLFAIHATRVTVCDVSAFPHARPPTSSNASIRCLFFLISIKPSIYAFSHIICIFVRISTLLSVNIAGIAPGLVSRIPVMSPARPSAPPTPTRTTSIPMPKAQKANAKSSGKGSTGGTRKRSTTLQVSSVESRHSSNALTSAKRNASNVFGSAQVAPVAASNKAAQSRRNESTLFNAQSHVQTTSAVAASTRRNQSSVFG